MVYFLRAGLEGAIKIGWTEADIFDRIAQLQIACPDELIILGVIARLELSGERKLHRQFTHLRIRPNGEWFRPEPDLLEYIAKHAKPVLAHLASQVPDKPDASEYGGNAVPQAFPAWAPRPRKPRELVGAVIRACNKCEAPFKTNAGDKYCKQCRNEVLSELTKAGYFSASAKRAFTKDDSTLEDESA